MHILPFTKSLSSFTKPMHIFRRPNFTKWTTINTETSLIFLGRIPHENNGLIPVSFSIRHFWEQPRKWSGYPAMYNGRKYSLLLLFRLSNGCLCMSGFLGEVHLNVSPGSSYTSHQLLQSFTFGWSGWFVRNGFSSGLSIMEEVSVFTKFFSYLFLIPKTEFLEWNLVQLIFHFDQKLLSWLTEWNTCRIVMDFSDKLNENIVGSGQGIF